MVGLTLIVHEGEGDSDAGMYGRPDIDDVANA